jgi:hypothetical protein
MLLVRQPDDVAPRAEAIELEGTEARVMGFQPMLLTEGCSPGLDDRADIAGRFLDDGKELA